MLVTPKYIVEKKKVTPQAGTLYTKGIVASNFTRAWPLLTGRGINVAVLDGGVADHPDLAGKITRYNLTTGSGNDVHATHVAGTIAANGWLKGGAPDAKIMSVKIINGGSGSIDDLIRGIRLAVDNGAHVINLSVGVTDINNIIINQIAAAISYAWNKGVLCVCASGNDGTSICTIDAYTYPGSIAQSICVAAANVNQALTNISLAPFSNENNRVDLAAIGVNVLSTSLAGGYTILSGTSMATPHVSAMVALLVQYQLALGQARNANFSFNLVNNLNLAILPMPGCKISFGNGFLRYERNTRPVPTGSIYNVNGVWVGWLN